MELKPHDLIKLKNSNGLISHGDIPVWVETALQEAPWVVVRRSNWYDGMIPVGVRGKTRSERFAAFLPLEEVSEVVTPVQLSSERAWATSIRQGEIEAIRVLDDVLLLMRKHGMKWGPAGSVGFELASGCPTARESSDLDIVIHSDTPIDVKQAKDITSELSALSIPIDVQLDTGRGAVSLAEYASGMKSILLKTATGPLLVENPWGCAQIGGVK